MHHLEVRRLASAYGSLQVLHDVGLTVAKGEVVSLIGPSGSGKSTILRVLMGLTPPTAGEVLIDGERIDYASRRSLRAARDRMAIVFQQYNLFQNMSVLGNVTIAPVRIKGRPGGRSRGRRAAAAGQGGPSRQARRLPRPALWRAAATGGDRACPGAQARDPATRRGDLGARPGAGGRGAGHRAQPRRRRHDHAHRQPRNGLRARGVLQGGDDGPGPRGRGGGRRRRSSTRPGRSGRAASSARSCGTSHGSHGGAGTVSRAAGGVRGRQSAAAGRSQGAP